VFQKFPCFFPLFLRLPPPLEEIRKREIRKSEKSEKSEKEGSERAKPT
jgi:hypothetical protein